MKKHTILLAVVLLTAGALATGCSSDDAAIENPIQQTATGEMAFSATIAPKHTAAARTRSVNESGVTTWVSGEQIAVYYQKTEGYGTATATVGTPNADGSAPITATLSGAKNGGEVKFVYPATLANATGDDIDESILLTQQRGVLTSSSSSIKSISRDFDAATAKATLSTDGTSCGTTTTIGFTNRVCICVFTFLREGPSTITSMERLEISIGGKLYVVTPYQYNSSKPIYLAMLPTKHATALFTVLVNGTVNASTGVTTYGENFVKISDDVTLDAGKFYTDVPITCRLATEYSGTRTSTIALADGAIAILNNLSMNNFDNGPCIKYEGKNENNGGAATIILRNNNSLTIDRNKHHPAIDALYDYKTLTILGSGSLTATGGNECAGIGSGKQGKGANIIIRGGNIEATGGEKGAGIGGGYQGYVKGITITSDVIRVKATAGEDAPYSIGKGADPSAVAAFSPIYIGGIGYGGEGIDTNPFIYEPTH